MPEAPSEGGRNLLAGTNQGKTFWSWVMANGDHDAEEVEVDGVKAVKLIKGTTTASTSWSYISYSNVLRDLIEANTKYTLSFDVNPSTAVRLVPCIMRGDAQNPMTDYPNVPDAQANQWQNISIVLTSRNPLPEPSGQVLYFRGMPAKNGNTIMFKNAKLEKGETATPYSQAPEDFGWSSTSLVPTQQQRYLWRFEYVYYSDGSVEVTQPVNLSIAGADADTTGVTDAINQTNQTVASLQSSVSQAQSDLATVSSNLTQARQNLESSIASVNTKAQAVETTLAQVQSTANSNSQKTATLENDLDGLNAKFSSLKIGAVNLLKNTKTFTGSNITGSGTLLNETYQGCAIRYLKTTGEVAISEFRNCIYPVLGSEYTVSFWAKGSGVLRIFFYGENGYLQVDSGLTSEGDAVTRSDGLFEFNLTDSWQRYWVKYKLKTAPASATNVGKHLLFRTANTGSENEVYLAGVKLEEGNIATDYSPNEADLELKVADYKQTAEQNYASLQSTVQNLDGTVQQNKTVADQTAQGFSTRIESLETYKDGESARANQYFESAKTETARQLTAERTAIANDYVAKSTYTSDVTGIRNDLTATATTANTTKTNLASYQASNDQAVASLQSSLQTTDGNVSNLQTQINAVPGQITSAVSAVEGKIPTEIGGRNLYALSKEIGRLGAKGGATNLVLDVANGTLSFDVNGAHPYFGECVWGGIDYLRQYGQLIPIKTNSAIAVSFSSDDFNENYVSFVTKNKGAKGPKVFRTQKIILDASELDGVEYIVVRGGVNNSNGSLTGETVTTKIKVEYGNVYTDWTPAPEDTASQISSLSSELSQTKDGMTLLATKTELNSAKTELQSSITTATNKADSAQATANSNAQTISTHTTQISALNTGLQAKVSQSDFDSLSGRVSSAESNLTATASQLSSQISSVENKIPTSVGGRNYIKNSEYRKATIWVNDNQSQDEAFDISSAFWQNSNVYAKKIKLSFCYQPSVAYETERKFPVHFRTSPWPLIGEVTYPANTTRLIKYTLAMTSALPANFTANQIFMRFSGNLDKGRYHNIGKVMLEVSDVFSDWSPAPEDYDNALSTAKSEIKQTTDSITASVTSVQTAASNAQATANTAVSKADAAQAGVNTLDSTTVKSASLNLDNNGFVTKVGKTIDGNKFATMIAQDANNVKIIADEMQVTANMIVDGAVTAEKLNVNNLSAVNSNLGAIKGGSLLLQENKSAGSATDSWGTYNRPAYKQGLFLDNHAFASSGAIQRKNGSETTPTDMPLAVLQSGELRFLVVDYNDNLENVVHYGLSDPDFGAIRFEIDSELKRRLTMTSSGYLNFQASNYTDWIPLSQQGCEYMIQGRLVAVNYDVTFSQGGTHKIGDIPQEFVKKELMLTAKAWSITPNDKNFQLNIDGGLHLLNADANVTYRGTLLFSY